MGKAACGVEPPPAEPAAQPRPRAAPARPVHPRPSRRRRPRARAGGGGGLRRGAGAELRRQRSPVATPPARLARRRGCVAADAGPLGRARRAPHRGRGADPRRSDAERAQRRPAHGQGARAQPGGDARDRPRPALGRVPLAHPPARVVRLPARVPRLPQQGRPRLGRSAGRQPARRPRRVLGQANHPPSRPAAAGGALRAREDLHPGARGAAQPGRRRCPWCGPRSSSAEPPVDAEARERSCRRHTAWPRSPRPGPGARLPRVDEGALLPDGPAHRRASSASSSACSARSIASATGPRRATSTRTRASSPTTGTSSSRRAPSTSASTTPSPPRARCTSLFAVALCCHLCLLVGWHARLFAVISFILVTSLDNRLVLVENGGYVVVNLVTLYACFLPVERRFSVDALRRSYRERHEKTAADLDARYLPAWATEDYVSLAVFLVVLNLAVVYFFNVINKNGEIWRKGETVHYVLFLNRMVTGHRRLLPQHPADVGDAGAHLGRPLPGGAPGAVDPLALRQAPHAHAGHPRRVDAAHPVRPHVPARALRLVHDWLVVHAHRARAVGPARRLLSPARARLAPSSTIGPRPSPSP